MKERMKEDQDVHDQSSLCIFCFFVVIDCLACATRSPSKGRSVCVE